MGMRATGSPPLTKYSDCSKDTIPVAARDPERQGALASVPSQLLPAPWPSQAQTPESACHPCPHHALGRTEEGDGNFSQKKLRGHHQRLGRDEAQSLPALVSWHPGQARSVPSGKGHKGENGEGCGLAPGGPAPQDCDRHSVHGCPAAYTI